MEFDLGTKNYEQAKTHCENNGMILASNDEIISLKIDNRFKGTDTWTPYRDNNNLQSTNNWIQIGNKYHSYGKIHNPKPSWGTESINHGFKKKFYCKIKDIDLVEYNLEAKNYKDSKDHCEENNMVLASNDEILKNVKFRGTDTWVLYRDDTNLESTNNGFKQEIKIITTVKYIIILNHHGEQ